MEIRTAGRAVLTALAFSTTLFGSLPARAELPAPARAEIEHLLTYVGSSGCEFYRNGSWYEGKKGQAHLTDKFNYLIGSNMINAATDFIDKAATQSSMSSIEYKVRCKGGEPVASAKWLNEELTRFRAATNANPMMAAKPATATNSNTMMAAKPATVTTVSSNAAAGTQLTAKPTVKVN